MGTPSGLYTTRRVSNILRNFWEPHHDACCEQPRRVRIRATVRLCNPARDANTRYHLTIRLQRPYHLPAPQRTTRTVWIVKSFTDAAIFASETHLFKDGSSDTRLGADGSLRQNLSVSTGVFDVGCVPISAQLHCASNTKKNC